MSTEIIRAAQAGDNEAFALIVSEHLAGLRAVAISGLGYGDEAEDAVQDALLIALRRLPELRDPAATGPWLRSIVRNNCRMIMRSRRAVPVADPEPFMPAAGAPTPEEALDEQGTRDWVRSAVAALPEPVREVTLLRYFSTYDSYAQIAALCGLPIDTVRSRLRDGRRALRRALSESVPLAPVDGRSATAASRHEAQAILAASLTSGLETLLLDRFRPDASLRVAGRPTSGRPSELLCMFDYTYRAGAKVRLREVAASRDLMVWETDFVNASDSPEHCPPGLVWLHSLKDGRTQQLRLAYRLAAVA